MGTVRLALVALLAVAAAACGGAPAAPPAEPGAAPVTPRFDERRAFAHLRAQVALGPRPAGSAASRRLAERLRRQLPRGRFEPVPGGLRNVVGHLPGRRPAILIGAHYDTKDIPGFVGANDGASGTATVVELSRALRAGRRACEREVRFALFDGEESPPGSTDFLRDGIRGSRAYAARHADALGQVIVVDFVGDRDLSLPREAGSDPGLWERLRGAAHAVGAGRFFPPRTRGEIWDDHTPFARAGIPSIDLIDFDYPYFHRVTDTLDKVSPRSLRAAGASVEVLVRRLAGETCR